MADSATLDALLAHADVVDRREYAETSASDVRLLHYQ